MSEIKVNKISPRTACGTTTLGDSGDTISIPAGVTITNSGTAAGFGSTGEVSWNTTKITADPSTAATGVGYFTDTSGGAFNVTLPASPSAGNVVAVADYANTWDTNSLTIARNGSNIEGSASDFVCNTEGSTITFVYVDATKGWVCTNSGNSSQAFTTPEFIAASGGTETTSGDFKIHTFLSPGTFTVSSAGNSFGSSTVSYVVVGGGGGAGYERSGGGGAGGFRESKAATDSYTASPLNATSGPTYNLPVSAQGYPITVGAGGTAGGPSCGTGSPGANSVFSTITSAGGGGGQRGAAPDPAAGANGGSGGGGAFCSSPPSGVPAPRGSGGTGNTPPVSPPQGNNGGRAGVPVPSVDSGAGGGGAGAVGANSQTWPTGGGTGGAGGNGVATQINPAQGSPSTNFAGGGGGGGMPNGGPGANGGTGGGADGSYGTNSHSNGVANTGGGGGGTSTAPLPVRATNGGSGIVMIRYKFQ